MQFNLLVLRKKYSMSQERMAKLLDVSESTYARKERGENAFTSDEMFIISKYFRVPIDEIFLPRKSVLNRQEGGETNEALHT